MNATVDLNIGERFMRELVVISGKGGTGKTSLAASIAVLSSQAVVADCDVDAPDLHLLLSPTIKERINFQSGHEAVIRPNDCIACGGCLSHCRYGAVKKHGASAGYALFEIDPFACEGCGVCVRFCPVGAIDFSDSLCGEVMLSDTRCGPMVHAKLLPAAENTGKLVSEVRRRARSAAESAGRDLIILDGPPGIGCPVIASLAGANRVLIVSEPTISGEHDLKRVVSLARHFDIPVAVCVNKWDINPDMTTRIEDVAKSMGATIAGRVRYDPTVSSAQLRELTPIEANLPCGEDIIHVWETLVQSHGI